MSDAVLEQMSKRLDEMSKRLDKLETSPKKPWYKVKSPSDLLFVIGLPAALIAATYGFYDGVYLKLQRLDQATVAVAQDKLSELQDLRSEIFVLQARGADAEIAAILEAKASRRDRLVKESYAYWQTHPRYFTDRETLLLAEELQLNGRIADALIVADTVPAVGPIAQADMARFKGSLLGAEGQTQDLDAARASFRQGLEHAGELDSQAGRDQLSSKISFSWLFMELSQQTGCENAAEPGNMLANLLADDPEAYNLGTLDEQARQLLFVHEERCL